jgi:hypothetical protein
MPPAEYDQLMALFQNVADKIMAWDEETKLSKEKGIDPPAIPPEMEPNYVWDHVTPVLEPYPELLEGFNQFRGPPPGSAAAKSLQEKMESMKAMSEEDMKAEMIRYMGFDQIPKKDVDKPKVDEGKN